MARAGRIITVGYTGGNVDLLVEKVREVNGLLVDVRFSAKSRAAMWSKAGLYAAFRQATEGGVVPYVHLRAWGNENYQTPGAPVVLVGFSLGLQILEAELATRVEAVPVLMCACAEVERCHRKVVAERLAEAWGLPAEAVEHWPTSVISKPKKPRGKDRRQGDVTIMDMARKLAESKEAQWPRTSMDPQGDEENRSIQKRSASPSDPGQLGLLDSPPPADADRG